MYRMEISRTHIENAAYEADLDTEEDIYWEYSGRYMYGEKCFGIVGSVSDFARFLVMLTYLDDGPDEAYELSQRVNTDSMGRSTIFYFPGVKVVGDDDSAESDA